MGAPTGASNPLEILEDGVGFWSLLRFLVPTLLGDPPDRLGHSWSLKGVGFRWSFALQDLNDDGVVQKSRIGLFPGRELEMKIIRTQTYAPLEQTYLDYDHRQGVHIRLDGQFILRPYAFDIEKLGSAVTDRAAVVLGRSVYRADVPRDRAETKISEAGTAFLIDEDVFLGESLVSVGILAGTLCVRLSNLRGRPRHYVDN